MNFSEAIKQYRTRNRLTLTQLSELSGVDRATLNRLERGQGNPRPMTVYMITEAMKLTPTQIDERLNPSESEIVDKPEASMPDNSMYLEHKIRELGQSINKIEILALAAITVDVVTLAYIVLFAIK